MKRRGRLLLTLLVLLVLLWFLDPLEWLGGRSKDRKTGRDRERGEAPPDRDPEPELQAEPGFIVGTVTAGSGEPLPGARINESLGSVGISGPATDDRGRYRLDRRDTKGRAVLWVNFRFMKIAEVVTPDAESIHRDGLVLDFAGPKNVVLRGFIAVRDGDALPGATISVGEHAATAGDRGKFSLTIPFDVLRPDPAPSLRVEADGHEPHEEPFPFKSHDDLAIFLEPK